MNNVNTHIGKNLLVVLTMVMTSLFLMTSCSKEEASPEDGSNGNGAQMVMINITDITDKADVLLLCNDGSYVMACMNDGNGHGLIHVGLNAGGEETQEYTIMVDADGIPVAIGTEAMTIRIGNITDTDFDCAVIDKGSEDIHYYWDIPYTFNGTTTRGLVDDFKTPFRKWYDAVSGGVRNFTWDEHSRKMLYPYLMKVTAFALQIITPSIKKIPSLLTTFIDEGYKSGLWDKQSPEWCEIPVKALDFLDGDGKWRLKFHIDLPDLDIAFITDFLIAGADALYEELSRSDPVTDAVFTSEEWQIKLSPFTIEAGAEAATYTASVTTQAAWKVEGGNDWCRVHKDGNNVVVEVDAYNGLETRACNLVVKTVVYTSDIPEALLHVVQQGIIFDLSHTSFTFESEGGHGGVYVNTNEQIVSWGVSGHPSWIEINGTADNSFFFDVEENTEGEDRTGIITVTGITANGNKIDRTISVTQYGNLDWGWDGTSWSFSGTVTESLDGISETIPIHFDMEITSVANGQIWISNEIGMPELSTSLDNNGHLIIDAKYSGSYSDEYSGWLKLDGTLIYTFERTGATTAVCKMSGSIEVEEKSDTYHTFYTLTESGSMNGVLKNKDAKSSVDLRRQDMPILFRSFNQGRFLKDTL